MNWSSTDTPFMAVCWEHCKNVITGNKWFMIRLLWRQRANHTEKQSGLFSDIQTNHGTWRNARSNATSGWSRLVDESVFCFSFCNTSPYGWGYSRLLMDLHPKFYDMFFSQKDQELTKYQWQYYCYCDALYDFCGLKLCGCFTG